MIVKTVQIGAFDLQSFMMLLDRDLTSEKRPPSQPTSRSSRRHFRVLMNASLTAPDAGHYCLPAWKHASAGFVTGTGAH
jgi:hypothetical protein